jgi:hypothetical protein
MKKFLVIFFSLLLVASLTASAQAQNIVYDGLAAGKPWIEGALDRGLSTSGAAGPMDELTGWVQADFFELKDPVKVTDAHFWTIENDGYYATADGIPRSWDGTLEYFFFSDAGYNPGALMASGDGQSIVKTATGLRSGPPPDATPDPPKIRGPEYKYSFDLETPLVLNPGKYWFGLHLSSQFLADYIAAYPYNILSGWEWITTDQIFWEKIFPDNPAAPYVSGARSPDDTFPYWETNCTDHPFQLTGEPVPEPGTLLLVGAGLLGLAGFRRKIRKG